MPRRGAYRMERNFANVKSCLYVSAFSARSWELSGHGRFMSTRPSTTLADLLTPLCVAKPFAAVRASLWRWSSHEFEDGLAHGREGRLRWRTVDSFFSVPLL